MTKNLGWTKKQAQEMAETFLVEDKYLEAYAQKEEHFRSSGPTCDGNYQWIVVLQKKREIQWIDSKKKKKE